MSDLRYKLKFTENDCIQMMHEFNAKSLRSIADLVEKQRPDPEELVKLLRSWSDEVEAQAIVVSLRDRL